jgi:hypothetical protein
MLHARPFRISSLVLAHAGLLALGCGIAERHVQERDDVVELAGTSGTGTAGTATRGGGASAGAAGSRSTMGGAGAGGDGDVTHGSGVELDPVDVGEPPTGPCTCGTGCTDERCDASTVAEAGDFLMNALERDGQIYWMSQHNLGRVSGTGNVGTSMAAELKIPSRVVVDARFAYFSSYQGLWKVPRQAAGVMLIGAGSAGTKLLASLSPWERRLTEIAVDSRDVYWTAPRTSLGVAQLKRTPVDGGTSITLARLPNDEDWPLGLAVDDTDVYFTSNAALQRVPKAGGAVEQLEAISANVDYDTLHPTLGIALDRDYVYFDAGSELRRRSKLGTESVALFQVEPGDELRGVVVDLDYAYFGTKSGDIWKVLKLGGTPHLMVSGEQNPLVTGLDVTSVYWVEQEAGRVRRATY